MFSGLCGKGAGRGKAGGEGDVADFRGKRSSSNTSSQRKGIRTPEQKVLFSCLVV